MSWEHRLGKIVARRTKETIELLELTGSDPFATAWDTLVSTFDLEDVENVKPSKEFFEFAAKSIEKSEKSFTEIFADFFVEEIKEKSLEKMLDD